RSQRAGEPLAVDAIRVQPAPFRRHAVLDQGLPRERTGGNDDGGELVLAWLGAAHGRQPWLDAIVPFRKPAPHLAEHRDLAVGVADALIENQRYASIGTAAAENPGRSIE